MRSLLARLLADLDRYEGAIEARRHDEQLEGIRWARRIAHELHLLEMDAKLAELKPADRPFVAGERDLKCGLSFNHLGEPVRAAVVEYENPPQPGSRFALVDRQADLGIAKSEDPQPLLDLCYDVDSLTRLYDRTLGHRFGTIAQQRKAILAEVRAKERAARRRKEEPIIT